MLKEEAKNQYKKDREALMEWMRGDHSVPFIMEKREGGYCACYLLFDSFPANICRMFRSAMILLAESLPFSAVKVFLYRLAGVKIGKDVFISPGVVLDAIFPELIELRDGCVLGLHSMILCHEYTADESRVGKVVIGEDSVIGAKASIRSGVTVGKNCTVGIGSYVNRDVADGITVGGVPAKILKRRKRGG